MPPVSRHLAYVSHAAEDNRAPGRAWADWVKESLESFQVPRAMVGRPTPVGPIPPRLAPVLKAEHDSGEALPDETRRALEQSRLLVVVCSPTAARTPQVIEEVRYFKQLGRDRVIALIVAGEPDAADANDECFPDTLKYEVRRNGAIDPEWRVHPVVIDARPGGRPGAQGDRLAQARRLLAAAALGVPPEALPSPGDVDEGRSLPIPARRGRSSIATWLAVFALLAAAVLGWLVFQSREELKDAKAARQRSDEVIVFLQRNLREKLAPLGQLGLLAEINERVTEHLGRVARETNDPVALSGLADAFRDSAEILEQRGNHQAALESAVQAVQTRQRVADAADAPADTPLQLIADLRAVTQIYLRLGQPREALAVAEQSRATAVALSRKRLGDEQAELALAQAHALVGDANLELPKLDEAERAYLSAREITRRLATSMPGAPVQQQLAAIAERFAKLRERQGDAPAAIVEVREWQRLLTAAAAAAGAPPDFAAQASLAATQMRLGNLLLVQRQPEQASQEFRKAADALEQLAHAHPSDQTVQLNYITALHRLGMSLAYDAASQGEALPVLERALEWLDQQFPGEADPKASTARAEIQRLRDSIATKRP